MKQTNAKIIIVKTLYVFENIEMTDMFLLSCCTTHFIKCLFKVYYLSDVLFSQSCVLQLDLLKHSTIVRLTEGHKTKIH